MNLLKDGKIIAQDYHFIDGDMPTPENLDIVLPLDLFLERQVELDGYTGRLGVRVEPDQDPEQLIAFLDRLNMIEIHFPAYRDGRGYSIAQILRRQLGFEGELRAVGDILRDQFHFLIRAGFDVLVTADPNPVDAWNWSKNLFPHAYQKANEAGAPIWALRARKS